MPRNGQNTFAVGDILDRLERATKEVAKSLDSARDRLDFDRLIRAREALGQALSEMDTLIGTRPAP
jgi:hypothetical protein